MGVCQGRGDDDEGRGDDDDDDDEGRGDDDDAHIKMMTQDGAGPQKNNLIKSLISEVDPHVPQIPGMQ